MAYIELVNNPIEIFEENELNNQRESLGLQSYWAWEHKILRQEQDYFRGLLAGLDAAVQLELEEALAKGADATEAFNTQVRQEVEAKFAKKRKFLEASLKRAEFEEGLHVKQQKYNRYERLFQQYAFPAGEYKIAPPVSNARITV